MARHLNRRDFLAGAALLSAPPLPAATPAIIDTHIHLYAPTRPQGAPWPPKTDPLLYRPVLPAEFVAMTKPLSVTGTVVVEASAWVEDNQWVLDVAKDNPVIVGLVGHLEPGVDFAASLARFARNPLFRGIRLNGDAIVAGFARPAFVEDLKRLSGAGLTLDAIGSAAMLPALLALREKVPQLRIAIDHMPAEPPGWRNARDTMRELAKSPQVYAKVSGVLRRAGGKLVEDAPAYHEALDEVWDLFGADRVMYGSNWPVSDRIAPYSAVFRVVQQYVARKGGEAFAKYFAQNSKACYRWVDRV